MSRPKRLTDEDVRVQLAILKRLIRSTAGAMPRAAEAIRQEAYETIDDLIRGLTR
jgi:hypothetical protein